MAITLYSTQEDWDSRTPDKCDCISGACDPNNLNSKSNGTCCKSLDCCPGEDGHKCGVYTRGPGKGNSCCCCPANEAPAGKDCHCVYVG